MKRYFVISIILIGIFFCSSCTGSKTDQSENEQPEATSNSLYAQSADALNHEISTSRRNAITQAVQIASPAVVGINVTEIRKYRYRDPFSQFWENDPFWGHFMRPRSRTFQKEVKGLGSGFLITDDGYILTNAHVAGNATRIVVTLTDGSHHNAKLIGADDLTDIALLKIDGKNFPHLKLGNSDKILIGEWAIALGNPFGLFDINDKPSVTVGVVSATGLNFPDVDSRSYRNMIQTDAAINSGNSGGPLLNAAGEAIGMNTFIYTGGGKGSIGIGFAVPVNKLKVIYDELRRNGKIDRRFRTGITVQPIDSRLAKAFGLSEIKGVLVSDIQSGSSGDKAGLMAGDIIIEANGEKIKNEQDLSWAIKELKAGDKLKLKIFRDRKLKTIFVVLEKLN